MPTPLIQAAIDALNDPESVTAELLVPVVNAWQDFADEVADYLGELDGLDGTVVTLTAALAVSAKGIDLASALTGRDGETPTLSIDELIEGVRVLATQWRERWAEEGEEA